MGYRRLLLNTIFFTCLAWSSEAKSCHYNNLRATLDWTVVRSPGYPGRFPAQTQCWWKISAPPQYKVQLEFTVFSLVKADAQSRCVWQWLNVIEGADDPKVGEPLMLTLCGSSTPRMIISNGNALRLNLHSNAAAANAKYKGFSARYKFTNEAAYMPVQLSNLLPSPSDGIGPPSGDSPPGGVSRTVGSAIAPFAPKAKPLPPNPNAVLTLRNRRTELRNQQRNNGASDDTNAGNNRGFPETPRRPNSHRRHGIQAPRPMPTLGSNLEKQEQPARKKPLRREYKILLAVMGTIAGLALIIFLVKKFVFDKAHKKAPGEGKVMHAYAHFRHFKKKRQNKDDPEASKVNTITVSTTSANGTLRSMDSGLSTERDTQDVKGETTEASSKSARKERRTNLPDLVMVREVHTARRENGRPSDSATVNGKTSTGQHRPREKNPAQREETAKAVNRTKTLPEMPPARGSRGTDKPQQRQRRRRRRRRDDGRTRHEPRERGKVANRGAPLRSHKSMANPGHTRHRREYTSSSDYSDNGGRTTSSWRDRSYY